MNQFTIKDLENLSGIKAHTIRIWEQRYNFIKPNRTKTNIRYYTSEELKTILNVSLLNKYGFKVSHINKMSEPELGQKILSLNQSEAQQERLLNELVQSMIELKMQDFEVILDNYISVKGLEKAINFLIFPFLEKIGILWLTNHVNPAQEHLVTNIIRQKLLVGIDKLPHPVHHTTSVLLFLPEGEYHELGLIYLHYILKERGIRTIYLGSASPSSDIQYLANFLKPDYMYTHLTTVAKNFHFDRFMDKIHQHLPNIPLIISGQLVSSWKKSVPPSIHFKKSRSEVMDFVNQI